MQARTVPVAPPKRTSAARPTAPRRASGAAIATGAASKRETRSTTTNSGPQKIATAKKVAPRQGDQPQPAVKPAVQRYVGYDDDDDNAYTSSSDESWESTQFNSENYQPLTFSLVKGGPTRAVGAVAQSNHSMRMTAPEALTSDSDSELSLIESPLSVRLHANDAKRRCGRVDSAPVREAVTVSMMSQDDSSVSSRALPITLERRKRARTVGPMPYKGPLEAKSAEEPRNLPVESDEDEAPLNAQVILNLVRRFRDPKTNPADIPLEAFQVVNWDDDSFQPELAPLRKLYDYLEAMASLKESVVSPVIASQRQAALQSKVKEAVLELPTEKAMEAKVKAVKSSTMRSATARNSLFRGEFSEAPGNAWGDTTAPDSTGASDGKRKERGGVAEATAPVNEGGKPGLENAVSAKPSKKRVKGNALSASGTLDASPVVASKESTAASGRRKKLKDSLIMSTTSLESSIREGYLSASNSEMFKPGTKTMSSQKTGKQLAKESTMTEAPNKTRRAIAKQKKKNNAGRSVSFTDVPAPEAREMIDDVEKTHIGSNEAPEKSAPRDATATEPDETRQKRNKERTKSGRRSRLGQSVSFASIPDEPAGEIVDPPPGLETPGKQTRAAQPPRRKRTAKSQNSRSCSFSEVQVEEAGEIRDNGPDAAAPVAASHSAPHADEGKGKKMVLRRRAVPKKSKRDLEVSAPEVEQGQEVKDDGDAGTLKDSSSAKQSSDDKKKKSRRVKPHRKSEISFSAVVDEVAGEIYENPPDNAYVETHSRPGTGGAARRNGAGSRLSSRPTSRQPGSDPSKAGTTAKPKPAPAGKEGESKDRGTRAPAAPPTLTKPQHENGEKTEQHAKRRRKRSSVNRELSISAIPDNEGNEIHEHPDMYLEPPSSSYGNGSSAVRASAKEADKVVLPRLSQNTAKK